MEERKLTGKLKVFNKCFNKIVLFLLAIICCYPFVCQKNSKVATAENINSDFENFTQVSVSSSFNCVSRNNNSIIKRGTADFWNGKIYENTINNNTNQKINLIVDDIDVDIEKSIYIWIYLPEVIIQDLVVFISDNNNILKWQLSGSEMFSSADYNLSLYDMIIDYYGRITKGWKLLELTCLDAEVKGSFLTSFNRLSIQYTFNNEFNIAEDFSILTPFVAESKNNKSAIINHQSFAVYADKKNNLDDESKFYIGDKTSIKTAKNLFSYVIVGKQNILENLTGFAWNIVLTKPSEQVVIGFNDTKEIVFEEKGYYKIDIILNQIENPDVPIISKDYQFFCEEFKFGYFQKTNNNFGLGMDNVLTLTLSKDFEIEKNSDLVINIADENIVKIKNIVFDENNIYLSFSAKNLGTTTINVSAKGLKKGSMHYDDYDVEITATVVEITERDRNNDVLKIAFGVFVAGIIIYLIILFVKSRRFGVN